MNSAGGAGTLSLPYGGRNALRVKKKRSAGYFCLFVEELHTDGWALGPISENMGLFLLHCVAIYVLLSSTFCSSQICWLRRRSANACAHVLAGAESRGAVPHKPRWYLHGGSPSLASGAWRTLPPRAQVRAEGRYLRLRFASSRGAVLQRGEGQRGMEHPFPRRYGGAVPGAGRQLWVG